jgi:hypothetical protein
MKYLLEHEAGFDASCIGFPSITGCHAICLATNRGLFGYHNAGGSAVGSFHTRAQNFLAFVQGNLGGTLPIVHHIYGSSFIGNNGRGYTQGWVRQEWRAELETIAGHFNYSGPISGCDLAQWIRGDSSSSAYVEYESLGKGCTVSMKKWSEAGKQIAPNPKQNDLKKLIGTMENSNVVVGVDRTGLSKVIPEIIRG